MINVEDVRKVAKLVRLRFSDKETEEMADTLKGIMKMIDSLNDLDCVDVEPLVSVGEFQARMREDNVDQKDISDEIFANVPKPNGDLAKEIKCFVVPKMVE